MYKKEFIQLSRSWYADAVLENRAKPLGFITDDITIMVTGDDRFHEFIIEWKLLGTGTSACINMFSEAWWLFIEDKELFRELAFMDDPTPEDVCEILLEVGYKDVTKETQE